MNQIICIILILMLIGFILFDYSKDKKIYRLFAVIPMILIIFFQTPFSNNISKTFSNLLVGITVLLAGIIFYLILKDEKSNN